MSIALFAEMQHHTGLPRSDHTNLDQHAYPRKAMDLHSHKSLEGTSPE